MGQAVEHVGATQIFSVTARTQAAVTNHDELVYAALIPPRNRTICFKMKEKNVELINIGAVLSMKGCMRKITCDNCGAEICNTPTLSRRMNGIVTLRSLPMDMKSATPSRPRAATCLTERAAAIPLSPPVRMARLPSPTTYTYSYAQKASISQTVTFKVVNGSWDEGEGDAATADKTVSRSGSSS